MFKAPLLALFLTFFVQNSSSSVPTPQNFTGELTPEVLKQFREDFDSDKRNTLSQNLCIKNDPLEMCESNEIVRNTRFFFEYELDEVKPITNQEESNRCWIFAGLNVMRLPFIKHRNLDEFEFSQAYLLFWDLIEKSNSFLHRFVEISKYGEKIEDKLISFFLDQPISDAGDWNLFVNLINRYGVVPKSSFRESWSSKNTERLTSLLNSKLREFSKVLKKLVEDGADDYVIEKKIHEQMNVVFRIVGICLGVPSETITWEYEDADGKYHRKGPISGLNFYKKYVKKYYNVDDKVYLSTDPRKSHRFGQLYELKYSGYFKGGNNHLHINQPIELLMNVTAESIMNNEAVWFGCEVEKRSASEYEIFDLRLYDMESIFGTDIDLGLTRGDRILYRDSSSTHAMMFNGVNFDAAGKVEKFKVENSWGEEGDESNYLVMTADWFNEFVFDVVVDKKFVPADVLDVFNQIPVQLPPMDPIG